MKKPNAEQHQPTARYLRELIERSGLSQVEAAHRLGINPRTMRRYLDPGAGRPAPYVVQYALEALAS